MNAVIERLRKEKKEVDLSWFQEGEEFGHRWSERARYEAIQNALKMIIESDGVLHTLYTDCIIEELRDIIDQHSEYDALFIDGYEWSSSELKFLAGFQKGVEKFWNEVKEKI